MTASPNIVTVQQKQTCVYTNQGPMFILLKMNIRQTVPGIAYYFVRFKFGFKSRCEVEKTVKMLEINKKHMFINKDVIKNVLINKVLIKLIALMSEQVIDIGGTGVLSF